MEYEKAFDRVDWKKLIKYLEKDGSRLEGLIGNLYMGQKIRVKIEGEFSESGSIGRGVRQGCPLSPRLFTYLSKN